MTWRQRLAAAKRRGKFASEDYDLANAWNTCAVGESKNWTHLGKSRAAEAMKSNANSRLYSLGLEFVTAVRNDQILLAKVTFDKIQTSLQEQGGR